MLKNKEIIISVFLFFASIIIAGAQDQYVYESKGKRDPFIALVTSDGRLLKLDVSEEVKGDLNLEGIIYDKNGVSFAIVNGGVVKIGDIVGDNQVLKIEKDKIIFIKDGATFDLELKKEEIK